MTGSTQGLSLPVMPEDDAPSPDARVRAKARAQIEGFAEEASDPEEFFVTVCQALGLTERRAAPTGRPRRTDLDRLVRALNRKQRQMLVRLVAGDRVLPSLPTWHRFWGLGLVSPSEDAPALRESRRACYWVATDKGRLVAGLLTELAGIDQG